MHEIYLVYLEPPYDNLRGWHIAMAAGALALLSAALYFANYSLSDVTIEMVWSEHRDVDRDRQAASLPKRCRVLDRLPAMGWCRVGNPIGGQNSNGQHRGAQSGINLLRGSLEKPSNEVQPLMGILDALHVPMWPCSSSVLRWHSFCTLFAEMS